MRLRMAKALQDFWLTHNTLPQESEAISASTVT